MPRLFPGDHPEPDVEQEGIEFAAGQRRRDAEPAASPEFVLRRASALDAKGEEVTRVVVSGVQERVETLVLAISPVEIDVLGRAGPLGQAQVKRETPP